MRRAARLCTALAVYGLGLIALVSAIALATPALPAGHLLHAAPAGRCTAKAHTRRRARRGSRCRSWRHGAARHRPSAHPIAPPSSNAPALPASASPGSANASPAAPVVSSPAPAGSSDGPISQAPEAPSPTPPSIPHVQVTAVEYHFTLSRTTVPAGKVIFDFVNHGQDEHNLNVEPGEGPLAGSFPNTAAGGVGEMEVAIRPGTYTLFCSLPEHAKKGMKATLLVE